MLGGQDDEISMDNIFGQPHPGAQISGLLELLTPDLQNLLDAIMADSPTEGKSASTPEALDQGHQMPPGQPLELGL